MFSVQAIPEVRVTPRFQSKRLREEAIIKCHVAGEPLPRVQWLKNDEPLNHDHPDKYDLIGNGTKLIIKNVDYADTGAYMCQASSIGGVTRDISSLVVQDQPTPSKSLVFHRRTLCDARCSACKICPMSYFKYYCHRARHSAGA